MQYFIHVILLVFLGTGYGSASGRADLKVTTHQGITINTDPAEGMNYFPSWGIFPSIDEDIRQITMKVTLGHPDTMAIAHWDYLDFIYLRRKGGVNEPSRDIEIGRMLTPYGSSFKDDWQFTWEVDVTDFSMLLRDSVEIEYMHSGWEPETLGWALTVGFEIVLGPPAAKPISITEIYNGRFPYGNAEDPIENHLTPFSFEFEEKADFGRIRIQHTGHGADSPRYCSEFCSRWRDVLFNGALIDHRDLWKDCGANPLYPQGGTWIHDRAYWCPGDLQQPDLFDVVAGAGVNTIQFMMEPYIATANVHAEEIISAYLVQYEKPANKHDVALVDVMVPSKKQLYSRQNPAVFNPIVVIKNLGSEPLEKVEISYGTAGFKQKKFIWKGVLAFNETEQVTLPGEIDFKQGRNQFEVSLERPNGQKDAWEKDNSLIQDFEGPKVLPLQFKVQYKTNNKPEENHLFMVNSTGDTIYQRRPEQCRPNEIYVDTVALKSGNYEFHLTDSAGDGLEFWARPQSGYGYLRLLDMEDNIIHPFISDCGNGQFLAFKAERNAVRDTSISQSAFFLYPRRTKKNIELDAFLPTPSTLRVQFMTEGLVLAVHEFYDFKGGSIGFDIGHLSPARYIVEIYVNDELMHRNRINRD